MARKHNQNPSRQMKSMYYNLTRSPDHDSILNAFRSFTLALSSQHQDSITIWKQNKQSFSALGSIRTGKEATCVKPTGVRFHLRNKFIQRHFSSPCVAFFGWPGTQPASAWMLGLKAPRSIPRAPKRNTASLSLHLTNLTNTIRRGGQSQNFPIT